MLDVLPRQILVANVFPSLSSEWVNQRNNRNLYPIIENKMCIVAVGKTGLVVNSQGGIRIGFKFTRISLQHLI